MTRRVQVIRWVVVAGALACGWPAVAAAQTAHQAEQPHVPATPTTPRAPRVAATPPPRVTHQQTVRVQGTELRLRDVAARIIIRPENRTDISVSIFNAGPLPAPEVRGSGRRVTIDGKLRRQIESCAMRGGDFAVSFDRFGRLEQTRLPVIEVRTPQTVVVNGNGAVRMHIGRAENAVIRVEGCGEADLESVEETASLTVSGDMSLRVYDVGEASVRVAGTGDVTLGVVREGLAASLAGEGDLTAARVDGPTNIAVQGEGDVTIRSGRATVLSVVVAGEGDVVHNGSAETLDAVVVGDGDVRVARVSGEISRRVFGGGVVEVGNQRRQSAPRHEGS